MLKWNDAWSVGDARIDDQHRELLGAIQEIREALQKSTGREKAVDTVRFLRDYVNRHFQMEEQLMRDVNFADYENHRHLHAQFTEMVKNLNDQLEIKGATMGLVGKLNHALRQWFVSHIQREDIKIAAAMKLAELNKIPAENAANSETV